mgnify:FL=1
MSINLKALIKIPNLKQKQVQQAIISICYMATRKSKIVHFNIEAKRPDIKPKYENFDNTERDDHSEVHHSFESRKAPAFDEAIEKFEDEESQITAVSADESRPKKSSLIPSGTITSSTITLVSTSLGVGVLALPYAIHQAGLINGIVALVCGGLITWWFLYVLVEASFNIGASGYAETIAKTFGKGGSRLFQIFFIVYVIGCLINYQITTASFMASMLARWGYFVEDAIYAQTHFTHFRVIIIVACNLLCIFPVSLAKSMYRLRHITVVIFGVVIYTLAVVILQAPKYVHHATETHQEILWYCLNPTIFSTFAVMIFAYNCNTNLFPIRMELAAPTEDRMKKICNRTIATDILIYAAMSVVAYLSFRDETTPLITNRPPLPETNDIYMDISRVMLCFSVMFSVAIRVHPCRQQIVLFFGLENKYNNYLHFFITFMLIASSAVIAMIFPSVYDSFTILGGYGTTLIGIFIPAIVFLKSVRGPRPICKIIITCLLMAVGTIMGFTAATFTLLKQLDIYTVPPCEA